MAEQGRASPYFYEPFLEAYDPQLRKESGVWYTPTEYDIYLNDTAYWRNIPVSVWEYCIGGYQVIKKWLSYRELELLGRALKPEEAREVMNIARRLTAIVLMQPALDENYRQVKAATYEWPGNGE